MSTPKKVRIRNSTAEFLVFTSQAGEKGIDVRVENETLWLTPKLIAALFDVDVRTVNEHLKNIFASGELAEASVIRKFRITATDGKAYLTARYHLDAIKAHLIPPAVTPAQAAITYASEADLLNVALSGLTAQQCRGANPKLDGNMRDHATFEQLLVLANIEGMNADVVRQRGDGVVKQRGTARGPTKGGLRRMPFGRQKPQFIHRALAQADRLQRLNQIAIRQMQTLTARPAARRLEHLKSGDQS